MSTVIRATCSECGTVEMAPSDVLISTIPGLSWYGWACACGEYRTVECCHEAVALLLSGDVPMIRVHYPAELDEAHVGPQLTEANVDRFVRLLDVLTLLAPFAEGSL